MVAMTRVLSPAEGLAAHLLPMSLVIAEDVYKRDSDELVGTACGRWNISTVSAMVAMTL